MTIERLRMYKTAYSKTYGNYVNIIRVYPDESGEPIIMAHMPAFCGDLILFRECELSDFCL